MNQVLFLITHYGIICQANNCFCSHLTHRIQFPWVNRFNSRKYFISHGLPQSSVSGPLLVIIFVNDLHKSIRLSQMLHLPEDTILLYIDKSMKKINNHINYNHKNIIPKFIRAIGILSKTGHYVPKFLLKTICSFFNSDLIYACQV